MALTALAGAPYYIVFVVPLSGRLVMGIIQEKRDFDAIRQRRHEIIDRAASEAKTIDRASLRPILIEAIDEVQSIGFAYDAVEADIDRLLESLAATYGSEIPINLAHKIVEDLEAGRKLRDVD